MTTDARASLKCRSHDFSALGLEGLFRKDAFLVHADPFLVLQRADVDRHADLLQAGVAAFSNNAEIGQRIVQLTLHHGLDLIHPQTASMGKPPHPVDQVSSDGGKDVLETGNAIVLFVEVQRSPDFKLMPAHKAVARSRASPLTRRVQ